jgi:hypothetical protein
LTIILTEISEDIPPKTPKESASFSDLHTHETTWSQNYTKKTKEITLNSFNHLFIRRIIAF